ncbi:MAG: arsenate reductase (glutaredoxin) [bacterium]|nr:arsenate reductase (glutaredoxin) [bacterium]
MSKPILWHNPKCSKSRQALDLLKEKGVEVSVVKYMNQPPSIEELKQYLKLLGKKPLEVMRRKETLFKELDLERASDEELIQAMHDYPKLIERPVLFNNGQVRIGRPTEAILEIL